MRWLVPVLLLAAARAGDDARDEAIRVLVRELSRAPTTEVEVAAPELRRPGAMRAVLLDTLVAGRVPGAACAALTASEEELVLSALTSTTMPDVRVFLDATVREPPSAGHVAAALRLLGRTGRPGDLAALRPLLAAFPPEDSARVEDALERAVVEWTERDPAVFAALPDACTDLPEGAASVVVRALGESRSRAALPCLRGLLGRREALTACVLQALARTVDHVDPEDAGEIAAEIIPYLENSDLLQAAAAATALGRLGSRLAVPPLVAALEREERPVARAALAALRAIGGVELSASPSPWTHWFAGEERWWRERAPDLRARLERTPATRLPRAELVALLAELSEHPLFRAELAPLAAPAAEHPDPDVRELARRALERLGSRAPAEATARAAPAPR